MYVKEVKNQNNKPMYLLYDNNGKIIIPAYRFILHLARTNNSKNTLKSYAYRLKLFYDWLSYTGLDYIDIVNGRDQTHKSPLEYLSDFIMWLKYPDYTSKIYPINNESKPTMVAKRKNKTINQIMSTIYSYYDYLSEFELLPKFEAYTKLRTNTNYHHLLAEMVIDKQRSKTAILKQKETPAPLEYITRDEFKKVYAACTCKRNKIICGLLFDGALRVSEVVGLRIEDLKELSDGCINITKRDDPNNPDSAVKYDSACPVYIPPYLVAELVSYLNSISKIDTDYLVFNLYGDTKYQPMSTDNIRKIIKRLGKKVGIPNLHPHAFRHGCAVELSNKLVTESFTPGSPFYGMQRVDIQDKLRHKNAQSTDIYAKVDSEAKKRASMDFYKKQGLAYGNSDKEFIDLVLDELMICRDGELKDGTLN